MLIFDGHNDLLLNLWLHHRDAPAQAFYQGIERGHLDFPRIQQGGLGGGLFAIFVPPQEYIARTVPARADEPFQPLQIMWQQLEILQQLADASGGRARLCRSHDEIAACRAAGVLAMVAHIEGADALDEEGEQLHAFWQAGCAASGHSGIWPAALVKASAAPFLARPTPARPDPRRREADSAGE